MQGDAAQSEPTHGLTIYRVGGAVRDQLLDFPSKETDWVVTGATPEALLARGFRQVGRDFPVFLHPETQEEYALARTERKTAPGYRGFDISAAPSVTLEEDLQRRDLTVNAMALDADGQLIDPYGGRADLEARLLRHVSSAFIEDPLRVLRVARFAARYQHLGFSVARETTDLMATIVANGELQHLSAERIWRETLRALDTQSPVTFFRVLNTCDAMAALFPGVDHEALWLLERATPITDQSIERWGALMATLPLRKSADIASRLKLPTAYRDLAEHVAQWLCRVNLDDAESIYTVLMSLNAIKTPESLSVFSATIAAIDGVRIDEHDVAHFLASARDALASVEAGEFIAAGITGAELGQAIRRRRINLLEQLITRHNASVALNLKSNPKIRV